MRIFYRTRVRRTISSWSGLSTVSMGSHCRKMLITWEGGGVALARCGLDEQREEVELEGPSEAKTWLGESFIHAMKRNHRHRQCHRNQRDARLGFCTQRTSVQFVCQPSHVRFPLSTLPPSSLNQCPARTSHISPHRP